MLSETWYYWEEKDKGRLLLEKSINLCEWYQADISECFVFFDSWSDLKLKTMMIDIPEKRRIIIDILKKSNVQNLKKWKIILGIDV